MNRDDIIRMAREAGCMPFRSPEYWDDVQVFATPDVLERFANLVAAAEREAIAEWYENRGWMLDDGLVPDAIRERGEK